MSYACQTCNEAVTHIIEGGVDTYHHNTQGREIDHDPVPVKIDPDVDAHVVFCDFCNRINAGAWDFVWPPFVISDGWSDDGLWLACDDCKALVEAGDWDTLIEQAKERFGTDAVGSITLLYSVLATLGPPEVRRTTIAKVGA